MRLLTLLLLPLVQLGAAWFASTPINELRKQIRTPESWLVKRDIKPSLLYPAYNLSVPIDHFHNESKYEPHSNGMFNLRYWYDATYYKDGGPVILLESGEIDASTRLPYLQKGIVYELSKATGGIGVILEHRYYGTSFPTPDLSTENLRFLTTDQALADTAYFAQNVVFKGLQHKNLTSHTTPYIAYGGSYAGAFVAFLRKLYPNVFWGAISSSGVTEAIYDYWEYYEPIRQYGPPECIRATQELTNVVDNILIGHANTPLVAQLKSAFGLSNITYDDDFANTLSFGIGGWQGRNWDPAINDPSFSYYCGNLSAMSVLYPGTENLRLAAQALLSAAGYGSQISNLTTPMLNYIGYVNATAVQSCIAAGMTQDECYTTHNVTFYEQDDLSQSWRSWPYQYCTQWGFLQTGSGVPSNELPLISRTITLPYTTLICRLAFNITTPPDTASINIHGGYNISYPRLAIIDGDQDPWRPATPHAPQAQPWNRANTASEPFMLIKGAVHHWDENGRFPNETTAELPPQSVRETQELEVMEVMEVMEWMLEAEEYFKVGR